MAHISIIVAVDDNNVIGKNNKLPWYIPEDLEWFKSNTMGKPVIMGRKTHESIGKKLPGRLNAVISRDGNYKPLNNQIKMFISLQAAIEANSSADEVIIIGGEQIYKEALPITSKIYYTHVMAKFDGDIYFPKLEINEWKSTCVRVSSYNNLIYEFLIMERR